MSAAAPAPRGRFAGRRVLVTGGGRGIGRACALAFAREGASVAICSRTSDELASTAAQVEQVGGVPAVRVTLDVGVEEHVVRGVADVESRLGPLDVLVNCAGVFSMGPTEDVTQAAVREALDTNVLGTILVSREVGRGMLERGAGRIVNFASLLSFTAFPGRTAYAASKGAVLQVTRSLAVEWAARGLTVNAVAPGMIRIGTPHPAVVAGDLSEDAIVARIPMRRRGVPEDVTGAVLFLASDDAGYITGQTIAVDGGWLSYGYL
ncbi:SDR family NAD(P)-dependent oxidoreductase [Cellulomonas phragmiteti]|uniref:2-deoxy-D-gluconate 3-dehydrogenase n=1 Tax=Cellulomonas phragmiteti TaxID=478780 RepID=A0ABQ4DR28_9CELL|nr:SDR family NAD(P)-dependent oxidoreductase [Cellulomonas phragmiteti]GIG41807.1 2-deoxy-D-gluconate 3-dehydrogenase [Cellulomonas phragmiteti]